MPYGYSGKILRIDLSTGDIRVEENDELFYRTYIGGATLGAYYLLKEQKAGVDPFSLENIIVIAPSSGSHWSCSLIRSSSFPITLSLVYEYPRDYCSSSFKSL